MSRVRLSSPLPVLSAFVLVGSFSSPAFAQLATAPKDDVQTLERSLSDEVAALSTSDCATACRALASIRRAADRICALDPGARCVAGRAKADDAAKRVREACPECAIASAPPSPTPKPAPAPEREERAMSKGGSADTAAVPASAPPSESKRGGCAGCTTVATAPGDLGLTALAVSAVALLLRRRRKRDA